MKKEIANDTLLNNLAQSAIGFLSLKILSENKRITDFEVIEINDLLLLILALDDQQKIIGKPISELRNAENAKIGAWFSVIHQLLWQNKSWVIKYEYFGDEYQVKANAINSEIVHISVIKQAKHDNDQKIIDELPLAYQSLDETGTVISVNNAWCKLTGYSKNDVIGTGFSQILHPNQQAKFFINFPKFKRKGYLQKCEYDIIRKDGSQMTIYLDGQIAYFPDGTFRQTHCFMFDKTEQKLIEIKSAKLLDDLALLNSTSSQLLEFNDENLMLEHIGKVLFAKYPNSIINISPVNESKIKFTHSYGLNQFVNQKLRDHLGYDPVNKIYPMNTDLQEIFRSGVLKMFHSDLQVLFEQLGMDTKVAIFLQKLFRINCIYLHGIIKGDKLMAIVLILTLGETNIENKYFVENLLQNAAIILENKVNQTLLKANKNFLDSVIENLPLGLQIFDKDGISKKMNSHQAKILGLKNRFEGVNKFNVLTDPFSVENGSASLYKQVYDHKDTIFREIKINFTANSSNQGDTQQDEVYINETVFPILNGSGEIESVITLLKDVTETKKNELALKESEQRLVLAMEGSGDGFWDWNINTNKVLFSDRWKQMLGYHVTEIKDDLEEWSLRVHPDDLQRTIKDVQDHLDGNSKLYVNEHRMLCKDGTYKWILDRGKVISHDKEGKPVRMIGTHSDITQRKAMENALRASEENYRKLISSMHDGVVLQNKKGEILTCNEAAEKILGLTAEQMMGLTSVDSSWKAIRENGKDFPGNEHPAMYTLQTGLPQVNVVMGVQKPDGHLTWISINSEPIFLEGAKKPSHVVTTFFDITKIKKSEQKLKKVKNELQQINYTKDRLFNIIGHDLKSPLHQIKELSKLVLKSLESGQYNEVEIFARLMKQAASNGESLLVNLLEWSRLKTQRKSIKKEGFNLNALTDKTLNFFSADLYRKNITIEKKFAIDAMVYANSNMIETVIRNIVSNALKFSYRDSVIEVLIDKHPRNKVRVSVVDHGTGIKEEHLLKLFDVSQTFTTPGTANEKGSGLGVVICSEFVEKNGGKFWVESVYNQGSTFSFSLPLKKYLRLDKVNIDQ